MKAMVTTLPSSCANDVAVLASGSTGRRHNFRRSTTRKMATASDPDGNADGDATDGDAAADGPVDTYAAANDAATLADYCRHAVDAAAADDSDGDDDGDDCDDDSGEDDDADVFEGGCTVVGDEDANVVAAVVSVGTVVAEDGREPLPLLIRAPPLHDLLAPLLLPKQVRGPVREVEECEYDWEEDP